MNDLPTLRNYVRYRVQRDFPPHLIRLLPPEVALRLVQQFVDQHFEGPEPLFIQQFVRFLERNENDDEDDVEDDDDDDDDEESVWDDDEGNDNIQNNHRRQPYNYQCLLNRLLLGKIFHIRRRRQRTCLTWELTLVKTKRRRK